MQAVKLSPSAGWHWIYAGWYLFRQQPMALFSWAMFVTLLLIVGTIAAPIGPLLFIALMPSITYVTLCISREVHAGRQLGPRQWLEPLRQPGLFKNCLCWDCCTSLSVWVSAFCIFAIHR